MEAYSIVRLTVDIGGTFTDLHLHELTTATTIHSYF